MGRRICFRADASAEIGYGHFIRSLALANMLKDDFECVFYTQSPTVYQRNEAEKVCELVALPADNSRFALFLDYLKGDEIVVLDNYFFTTDYQRQIKAKGCKLVCIDDLHNKHYVADVVINQGVEDEKLFSKEVYTKLCLGLDWTLLRKVFLSPPSSSKKPNHWFISFGGSDFNNFTYRFCQYLNDSSLVDSITAVVGDAYKYTDSLHSLKKVAIKKNLTAKQMHDEMSLAEYALVPSSSVCIETLACKCKIASGYYVDNQRGFYNFFVQSHRIYPLGNLMEWENRPFIKEIRKCDMHEQINFTEIPTRYINLFKQI